MAEPVPKDYWTFFAAEAKRGKSPLYERLALGIRTDDKLPGLAARVKPGQPQANLVFGAVHYLLLSGVDHPLAEHYPSVRPNAKPAGDAFPLFRDFVAKHEKEVAHLVETRVTNTNEVARSIALYPAFDFIAREVKQDLHLIEIGPSAGFNLNWDRYAYHYRRNGAVVLAREPKGARLSLEAELRGDSIPPLAADFPSIASRIGLELNPVDLDKPQDRLWLKALIWPELTSRFARLDGAIATALAHPHRIWAGDALQLLPDAIKELPPTGIPVVYHSHVTYQFTSEMRRQLNEIIETQARKRPIYRTSVEWDANDYPVNIGRYGNGRSDKRTIASCDPHGAWLEWRARS